LTSLARGKGRINELVGEIYPELDRRLLDMARGQVLAHLIKLEREGKVAFKDMDGEMLFLPV